MIWATMVNNQVLAAITSFDDLPIPGGILDSSGTIVAVNRKGCALLGRPAERLVDQPAWTFAPGIEHAWPELVKLARTHGEHRGELAIATPGGAQKIRYVIVVRDFGETAFVLAFALDVVACP